MAFKSAKSYNEERYGGFFLLRNDGDYADVIFLYQNVEDVLVADVHYLKSNDYSGYVHCCGKGCPACQKGIRTQTKLFIPVYNIMTQKIEYFDRTMKFEPQLQQDVFARFPNPSEYVFRIVRHGAAGSMDTTYEITAVGSNSAMPYGKILADNGITMPEHYNTICRDVTPAEMQKMLSDTNTSGFSANQEYSGFNAVPRGAAPATPAPSVPHVATPAPANVPEYIPEYAAGSEPIATMDASDASGEDSAEDLSEEPTF